MKKLLTGFLVALFGFVVGIVPASATTEQLSPWDSYTPYWSYDEFDVDQVSFRPSAIPGRVDFLVEVAGPISYYSYTLGDYLGVGIDVNLDGNSDYYMFIDDQYFDDAYGVPTDVWDANNQRFVPGCDAEFWQAGTYVAAFDLIPSCINLPSRFGIMGFAYTSLWDEMDLVPEYHFQVTYTAGSSTGGTVAGATQKVSNPPSVISQTRYKVQNPGSAPDDLVSLSSNVGKSVVTLYCGDAQGTGWSAKVKLSSAMTSAGVKSYIITNHHVVDGCLGGQDVDIVTSTGASYTGKVVGWDEETDVAALTTTASIAGLEWVGEKPAVGWWAGVMGSPFNNQGTLTTGIVSSIVGDEVVTTAPLNPGNSGGPVFDRTGRVYGIATAIRTDSNLIGFAGSTNYLCDVLVTCSSAWLSASSLASAPSGNEAVNTGAQGPQDGPFSAWTKVLANGTQMKFYVKYPQVGDKIQFMVQDSSGTYKQFAWIRINEEDLGADGNYVGLTNDIYFIRTFNLKPGKNRVRIVVNGEIVWGTKTYSMN